MEINFKESELDALLGKEHQKPYEGKEFEEVEDLDGLEGTATAEELNEEIHKAMRRMLLAAAGHGRTGAHEPKQRGPGFTRKPASKRKR